MSIKRMDFLLVKHFPTRNRFTIALKILDDQYVFDNGQVYTLDELREEGCLMVKVTDEDIAEALQGKFDALPKL